MRNSLKGAAFACVLTLLLTGMNFQQDLPTPGSSGTDVVGDVIRQSTSWTIDGSPYRIREAVQIAEGAVLSIEPGVVIEAAGADSLFLIAGGLSVAGSAQAPVRIQGDAKTQAIIRLVSLDGVSSISLSHAYVRGGGALLPPSGGGRHIRLSLVDSVVQDVPGYNYIWYPRDTAVVARNVFLRSGGFSVGFDARNPEYQWGNAKFESNRFQTPSTTGYWIRSWASYGSPLEVTGNAFLAAGSPSVELQPGYSEAAINAGGNYWGTTDPSLIDRMVLDSRSSLDRAGTITTAPILADIPPGVPPLPALPPDEPTKVTATLGVSGITVNWQVPADTGVGPIASYEVSSIPSRGGCSTRGATSCVVSGLEPGASYRFTVVALNSAGASNPSSPSAAITFATPPGKVQRLAARSLQGALQVSWLPPNDLGGSSRVTYEYQVGKAPWKRTSALRVTVPGTSGKALIVRVRAINAAGPGSPATISAQPR